MTVRAKNLIYSLVLLVAIALVWVIRGKGRQVSIQLEGRTMGTSYHITYFDPRERNYQHSVDSLLALVNQAISTYDTASDISRFNRSTHGWRFHSPYFFPPLKKSREVVSGSNGSYDPTIMPLVNAWGFGPRKIERPDTAEILSLRDFVGFEKISFNSDSIWKTHPKVQLDFSAIGQGYGADVIADFFRARGVEDFLIEVGGEGVAGGKNLAKGRDWEIGILDPKSAESEMQFRAYAVLTNKAFSTSGNYYNYREVDGKKFSHTIDPVTGFPVQRELLSATVFAADCSTADAWATAFMAMGHERGKEILKTQIGLDVLFIFATPGGDSTFVSPGIAKSLQIQP